MQVLKDTRWAELAPLIEGIRPKGKTPPQDLRRTIEAILWRHDNGAKWRTLPAELGPWHRAAQRFIRWAKLEVWRRLLDLVQRRGVSLGLVCMDGTGIRAHGKAAGAAKKGSHRASETAVSVAPLRAAMAAAVAGLAAKPA